MGQVFPQHISEKFHLFSPINFPSLIKNTPKEWGEASASVNFYFLDGTF